MEEAAAVVVAEKGQHGGGSQEAVEEGGHAGEGLAEGVVKTAEDGMEEEHVEGVDVIVGGQLEMAAVGEHLAVEFTADDLGAGVLPAAGVREMGQECAEGVERYGFAEKVGVRREVVREVFLEVAAMTVERFEKAAAEGRGEAVSDEHVDPEPGERTERDFESAGPIDAALKGVLGEPALELGDELGEEPGVAGKEMSLRQEDQVLVAIELPDAFVIASEGGIEVGDAAEIRSAGCDAGRVVASPMDVGAGGEGVAEEGEAVVEDFFGELEAAGGERGGAETGGYAGGRGQGREGMGFEGGFRQARRRGEKTNVEKLLAEAESDFVEAAQEGFILQSTTGAVTLRAWWGCRVCDLSTF